MNIAKKSSRRSFLNLGAGAAAALGLSDVLAPLARAASMSGRACVCIYLIGGNDSNNMVVPLDSPAYEVYAGARGPLALPKSSLLPVDSGGSGRFGFHPNLPGLRDLYNQNALAILANVGQPSMAANHTGASQLRYLPNGYLAVPWADPVFASMEHGVTMAAPDASGAHAKGLAQAIRAGRSAGNFPDTHFGSRLQVVAQALVSGAAHQPVFLVPLEGFDTHDNQLARQAAAFSILDAGLTAFYQSMHDAGLNDRVTVYTDTEFNRTLVPNPNRGTGHGWGGHQMILGGSVLGGRMYGRFPSHQVGGADDATGTGVWRPSTLDLQYVATIAGWYGKTGLENTPGYEGLRGISPQRLDFMAG